jgi:hypothetical protein
MFIAKKEDKLDQNEAKDMEGFKQKLVDTKIATYAE